VEEPKNVISSTNVRKNLLYIIADEKYLAFVTSQRAHAKIISVDSSEAVKLPGVVDFISYKDIPGQNRWGGAFDDEEIFASEKVSFYNRFMFNVST
jgi:xanthine dehydrogenase molybdopterin-binding subunit B